jgi:hypothetical protein
MIENKRFGKMVYTKKKTVKDIMNQFTQVPGRQSMVPKKKAPSRKPGVMEYGNPKYRPSSGKGVGY